MTESAPLSRAGPPHIGANGLKRCSGIWHGYFERGLLQESGAFRPDCLRACGLRADSIQSLDQVHGTNVHVADFPLIHDPRPRADAAVSRVRGVVLCVRTADCAPILFADGVAGVVGAAHAGWRGAISGVIEATIEAMCALGATRSRICADIGPCISRDNYEIGPEFLARFLADDPANARFFAPATREGRRRFDLPAYILARLVRAGVAHAEWCGLCTCETPQRWGSRRHALHHGAQDFESFPAMIMRK